MLSFFIAGCVLALLSFIPELFLKLHSSFNLQTHLFKLSTILHLSFLGLIFLIVFIVFHRPFFAMIVALVTLSILVIVSNAKYKTLREPLVFSDIAMFSQAFKHPRLYLPFLGIIPAISAPIVIGLAVFVIIHYEPAIQFSTMHWLMLLIVIVVIIFTIQKIALQLTLTQDPIKDINQYRLIATLLAYAIQARTSEHKGFVQSSLLSSPMQKTPLKKDSDCLKPNIIVIQSESFFDVRNMHSSIKPMVLNHFDQFCRESTLHGQLNVPAWGANTMRTEFSVLTGVPSNKLGFYRFYPYQYLSKQKVPSLAHYLKKQGYHCVCVHPHPASFFGRDRIFPKMGFDEFIDIESFNQDKKFGPYLSDEAVTEKIIETLSCRNKHNKPLFVFVITMENHGPLHLEKTDESDMTHFYDDTPPAGHHDLTVYLRHLKNADQMLADLHNELKGAEEDSILCFYGDHVPSMSNIYETTAYLRESTDYFIWHSNPDVSSARDEGNDRKKAKQKNLNAEDLLLQLMH